MISRRMVLGVVVAVPLAACSIGRPIPQATTYSVDPSGDKVPLPRLSESLRMGFVRVAAAYAGSALVYRLDDVRYATDPYHAFVADPGAMLGGRIAEWLDRAGPFRNVAAPGSAQPARFVLEATVDELYGDFRPTGRPAAVLSVQFALIDEGGARSKVVYERTIGTRVELPKATPDALVRGYGTALGDILTQLVANLSAQDISAP